MTNSNIRKILKLFCIADSGRVHIEPSWKSWLVFCIFLLVSILVFVSGVYFQPSHIYQSTIFCFVISGVGFGMTLAVLLAILLGYYTRRRRRVSSRSHVGGTNDARPARLAISEESVWLDIEKDALTSSHNAESNRQWMNPVCGDGENPLYETELEQCDCYEEVYSNDSRNSVKNVSTCSYNSSPEDYDCYRIKSEDSDLKEVDGHCFGNYQKCGGMVEEKSPGRVEALKMVSNHTSSANVSKSHQESKLDRFQVYLHNKMTSQLPDIRNRRQSSWSSMEGEMLLNGKSSPVKAESGFYENTVCLDSSFHSNYEEPNEIYLYRKECDSVQEYSTECRNAQVNLNLGASKHTTVADLKYESHANTEHSNELEQNTSFYLPKSCEEYQNNYKYSKLIQVDKFTVTNKDIDLQTSEESYSLSKPVSYEKVKTAIKAHARYLADEKYSQPLEQCPYKLCARCCNAHEISKSQGKTHSRSEMKHCDGAASSRPLFGSKLNSPTVGRPRIGQYQSRRERPSIKDFENGFVFSQMDSAEYKNGDVNLDLGALKHTAVADLKHESHTNMEHPNELEQNISFYRPDLCEEYQNNSTHSKQIQLDKFTATNKDIDIQTSAESSNCYSQSSPVSYEKVKTALIGYARDLADKKSKSQRKSYSRSVMEHCDGAASSRPMTGFESNRPTAGRHKKAQDESRRGSPSREDFENGLVPLRYPIPKMSEASVHSDRKRWKENVRIRRRPLLDVNGEPISQSEYVKVLSKLLKKGQQSSRHPMYARPYNYISSNPESNQLYAYDHQNIYN